MTPEQFLEQKGWDRQNDVSGGALFLGVAKLISDYHEKVLPALLAEQRHLCAENAKSSIIYADDPFERVQSVIDFASIINAPAPEMQ